MLPRLISNFNISWISKWYISLFNMTSYAYLRCLDESYHPPVLMTRIPRTSWRGLCHLFPCIHTYTLTHTHTHTYIYIFTYMRDEISMQCVTASIELALRCFISDLIHDHKIDYIVVKHIIDGLVQERRNSSALAMELCLFFALTYRYCCLFFIWNNTINKWTSNVWCFTSPVQVIFHMYQYFVDDI